MNTKYKILTIFVLSLFVLGAGGAFIFNQFSMNCDYPAFEMYDFQIKQPTIIPNVTLGGGKSASRFIKNDVDDIAYKSDISASIPRANVSPAFGGYGNNSISKSNSGKSRIYSDNEKLVSSGSGMTSGLLAFAGRRSLASTGEVASGSVGGNSLHSQASILQPFNVPQVPSQVNNMDPGTDIGLVKITPIGEGWWLLVLLALGYVRVRKFK